MNRFTPCQVLSILTVALICSPLSAIAQMQLQPLSELAPASVASNKPVNPKPAKVTSKPASDGDFLNPGGPYAGSSNYTSNKSVVNKSNSSASSTIKVLTASTNKTVQDFPAKKLDLLRAIPLEVSGYASEVSFPEAMTSANQVVQILDSKRNLLVHMEAIRRSYAQLTPFEQDRLMGILFDRYRSIDEDPVRFFDYGYAQLVIQNNKTGLFFLRKANDAIKDQFSSLAYAAAQVEADINFEDANNSEMTPRKLDAIFRLKDAVSRDANKHKPGFWPSYVRLMEKIKTISAYKDFSTTDVSVNYVPYGNISVPPITTIPVSNKTVSNKLSGKDIDPTLTAQTLFQERYVDLLGTGHPIHFQAYNTAIPSQYRVILWDGNQAISDITSPNTAQVMEDIDGDNQFELVVRQYAADPLNPIRVYRYKDNKFELDTTITDRFR